MVVMITVVNMHDDMCVYTHTYTVNVIAVVPQFGTAQSGYHSPNFTGVGLW